MTATERLRELLDERGVEWEAFDDFEQTTQWSTYNGAFVYWARERDGKLLVETTAPTKCSACCTPEQAIAATLGQEPDDAAMVKLHDQMNAAMLKYEMAQGIEKRDGDEAIVVPWVAKMHALLEEAAALGSCNCSDNCTNGERTNGTCHADETERIYISWQDGRRVTIHVMECSECGRTYEHVNGDYEYCPRCGRKVVDA